MPFVNQLRAKAFDLGFTLFGVAPAMEADGFGRFCDWLDAGYAGEMKYLHKYREHRRHPSSVVESVRSVVMLAMDYSSFDEHKPGFGRVAKYAQGPDYHRFIWDRLNELAAWQMETVPDSYAHGASDSAPLLERDFARRAGLGWFGKNTMLLNKQRGSFFFLAALLTSIELPASVPHTMSHCGTCTACLDVCPTDAFPEPGKLDARKCISYLTIEHRGEIDHSLRPGIGDWMFGCDLCQDVCPWNSHAKRELPLFPHNPDLVSLEPTAVLMMTEKEFKERFEGTSILRTRRSGLRRNAAIVLGNIGDDRDVCVLQSVLNDDDPIVREAAAWAIQQITQRARLASDSVSLPHPRG